MVNNGAYTDKMPMTFENCASINNNIAGIRIGQEDSDTDATTYIRNCLIAVTETPEYDDTNVPNARGIRMREKGNFVIENCYFIYLDADGTADLIEIHDGAEDSTVTIRNCAFYNDSGRDLVRDKGNGMADVTIEDCSFHGSGSDNIEPDYEGNGLVEREVTFPYPSEITGYAVADEAEGVGPGIGPWGEKSTGSTSTTDEEDTTDPANYEHTLVLEASEDNPTDDSATPGDFDLDVYVSGEATFGETAEQDQDSISSTSDGGSKIDVNNLKPGELDSFRFNGEVVDYQKDDGYAVTVSLDGNTTTFEDLVGGDSTVDDSGDGSSDDSTDGSSGGSTDDSTDGGSDDSTDGSTDGGSDDSTDGSTDSGSDDSTDGSTDGGSSGSSDGGSTGAMTKRVVVDGSDSGRPTNYTFTVSGDVERDTDTSSRTADGTNWDRVQDFAQEEGHRAGRLRRRRVPLQRRDHQRDRRRRGDVHRRAGAVMAQAVSDTWRELPPNPDPLEDLGYDLIGWTSSPRRRAGGRSARAPDGRGHAPRGRVHRRRPAHGHRPERQGVTATRAG
ncbi:right-handed parallel beta-helix repeat-containing protein [Halobaculum litoreum]|uniref:Right-handed parallel beta-helix repeat-containing protein n=1 Tax=Halobaculum litoreum TaxID=3031998 RepID=A0ABD5XRX3_9EURY